MKLAIMQPYFLPYLGYFQLIAAVDQFVIYDNIQYSKKGWINRNRLLKHGSYSLFSLPIKRASDYLNISERELAIDFKCQALLNQFKEAYRRAPQFQQVFPLLEKIIRFENRNLFQYLHHSVVCICDYLQLKTKIKVSSDLGLSDTLKGVDRVIASCHAMQATTYINAIGGINLYSKTDFEASGLTLNFLSSRISPYPQFESSFLADLSIVDVLMFNTVTEVKVRLRQYDLI